MNTNIETEETTQVTEAQKQRKILFFQLPNCAPCNLLKPKIKLAEKDFPDLEVDYILINESDSNLDLASSYGVRAAPTLIFLNEEGDEVYRETGSMSYNSLENNIKQYLYN